jgi:hypothetical protein
LKDYNGYYNERFLRGLPHLVKKMRRLSKGEKKATLNDDDFVPDFAAISLRFPLPGDAATSGATGNTPLKSENPPCGSAAIDDNSGESLSSPGVAVVATEDSPPQSPAVDSNANQVVSAAQSVLQALAFRNCSQENQVLNPFAPAALQNATGQCGALGSPFELGSPSFFTNQNVSSPLSNLVLQAVVQQLLPQAQALPPAGAPFPGLWDPVSHVQSAQQSAMLNSIKEMLELQARVSQQQELIKVLEALPKPHQSFDRGAAAGPDPSNALQCLLAQLLGSPQQMQSSHTHQLTPTEQGSAQEQVSPFIASFANALACFQLALSNAPIKSV